MAETVQLFVTCLIDSFFPQIGEAMVNVLNRDGVRLVPQGSHTYWISEKTLFRYAGRRKASMKLRHFISTQKPKLNSRSPRSFHT